MVRFNSEPAENFINYFNIEPKDFFSLCNGSVLLYFEDGLVIGMGDDPSQNTLVLWVEKNEIGDLNEWLLEEWEEAIPCYAKDFAQWECFLGQSIVSVTLIKEIDIDNENPRIDFLPSERGILLAFDNGLSLVVSYGLYQPSYDTTIITPTQINPYFNERLVYTKIA